MRKKLMKAKIASICEKKVSKWSEPFAKKVESEEDGKD